MGYSNILDAVDIINNRVEPYDGDRVYLDTGGLQIDKIEDIRKFDFESKPSRANQNVKIDDIILARMKETTKVKVITKEESMKHAPSHRLLLPKFRARNNGFFLIF